MYHIFTPQCQRQDSTRLGEYHPLGLTPADPPCLIQALAAVFARIGGMDQQVDLAGAGGGLDAVGAVDEIAGARLHAQAIEDRLAQRLLGKFAEVGRHLHIVSLERALQRCPEPPLGVGRIEVSAVHAADAREDGRKRLDQAWRVGGGEPKGELAGAIDKSFGSFSSFKGQFTETATKIFGSGWAWLVLHGQQLKIETAPNQDNPISQGRHPLLGIDVWEHAYYLKYQNRRPDYIVAWFNVINWDYVSERYAKLRA